ncbi:MAG: serine/threonine protein kinase [Planctomycetota bacterium]|jgi:serine/threonine protein kinase
MSQDPKEAKEKASKQRYEPIQQIGQGGMATVSRTLDRSLRRMVATKELRFEAVAQSDYAEGAMAREIQLVGYLDHPGIVPVYDRLRGDMGLPGYAMKLITGQTLAAQIDFPNAEVGATPVSVAEAVNLLQRIAETLAYTHDRGVLHLDLKPENLMIGGYGEVYLMDWGNGRLFDPAPYRAYLGEYVREEDFEVLHAEPPSRISGTIYFMSPEQTIGDRDDLGRESDIFSAGVLFYLLLTGRLPFAGRDLPTTLIAIQQDEPISIEHLRPGIPRRLEQIALRMLAKKPADRYPNFQALLTDLADYQAAGHGFELREFKAGDVIFDEGDEGDCSYDIVSGRVAVDRSAEGQSRRLAELGPGEVLGEIAILARTPRSASATALEASVLRVLPRAEVREELEKLAPWVGSMISTLASRFLGLLEEQGKAEQRNE